MGYPKIYHPNQTKYIKAPTYEQIMKVVNAHGVPVQQFERFYGIYITCIKQIRRGTQRLPPKHWHIIFENLKKIDNNEPMPAWNPSANKIPSIQQIKKHNKKKRTAPVKKTGLIGELL